MFSELFAIAPDAMIAVDHDGRIVRANPQAERLFGYRETELRTLTVEALLPESARHAHRRHRAEYASNPRIRHMGSGQELTGRKRDGSEFPVEIALSPLDTADGRMFLASIRDISETQRARQALARAAYDTTVAQIGRELLAARNLDAAVTATPELIARTLDVDAVAIAVRQPHLRHVRVQAAFGVPPDLVATLPWPSLLGADAPREREGDGGVMLLSGDLVLADAGYDGAVLVPFFAQAEPLGALVAIARRRRDFDRDAVHFLQSVANLLAAAMQRIRTEEQLSHAQRLEAIGQLTGGIAHDFNNLLTVVSGNLQLLRDGFADGSAECGIVDNALYAVMRGGELTHKLLAFARQRHLSPRPCDPKKLLDDVGAMLRRALGETVRLEIEYPLDIPPAFADPGQLDGALVNLALNARDAMPRGGDLLISAAHRRIGAPEADNEAQPGEYVVFSVRDTGMGMTPEVLARAFEPFFTTKEQGKGSGLGLSMVYGFVKQSGGHVSVDTRLGYGTCIKLHLPVATRGSILDEAPAPAALKGNETILVVEDEVHVREIAVKFLLSMGYRVVEAVDGEAALQRLAEDASIQMLFSDVVLGPGMNGAELAEAARRLRPDIPVLLTSGYERSAYEGGAAAGIELLQKPYRREQLAAFVRRTLDRANGERAG